MIKILWIFFYGSIVWAMLSCYLLYTLTRKKGDHEKEETIDINHTEHDTQAKAKAKTSKKKSPQGKDPGKAEIDKPEGNRINGEDGEGEEGEGGELTLEEQEELDKIEIETAEDSLDELLEEEN